MVLARHQRSRGHHDVRVRRRAGEPGRGGLFADTLGSAPTRRGRIGGAARAGGVFASEYAFFDLFVSRVEERSC